MSQFISLIIHGSIPVFYDCGFPPYFGYLTIFEASLFFCLFFNFYVRTYNKKPAPATTTTTTSSSAPVTNGNGVHHHHNGNGISNGKTLKAQ